MSLSVPWNRLNPGLMVEEGGEEGEVMCGVSKPPHHPLGTPQTVCCCVTKPVMYDEFSQISCFTCVALDLTCILRNGGGG